MNNNERVETPEPEKTGKSRQVNIFQVPVNHMDRLFVALRNGGLEEVRSEQIDRWAGSFWLTRNAKPRPIGWLQPFEDLLDDRYMSIHHSGAYVLTNGTKGFAFSYGQSFHYIGEVADSDFGMEMATRIGDSKDVRQHGLRRFGGKRHKEITSFGPGASLFVRNGEAVDLLKIRISEPHRATFGRTADFGHSLRFATRGDRSDFPSLCDAIIAALGENQRFGVPAIVALGEAERSPYDKALLDAILGDGSVPHFTAEGHDLVGVDFIFSGSMEHRLKGRGRQGYDCETLDLDTLRKYIANEGIAREDVFGIDVKIRDQFGSWRTRKLKKCLEFTDPEHNVTLDRGRWRRFNTEYLVQLDQAVDRIEIADTEPELLSINLGETDFNSSDRVAAAGYSNADRDFKLLNVPGGAAVEAYDLSKGGTQYAVKFGGTRDFLYLCAQASAVLEIARNKADDAGYAAPSSYCLWLGFRDRKSLPTKLSDLRSMMLKQRLASWAQECHELDITPAVKFSHRVPTDDT